MFTPNSTDLIFEEVDHINALPAQGEQSIMVQKDMKKWGLKEGLWPHINYHRIIESHAEDRGWTQEGFTGLEMPHEEEV